MLSYTILNWDPINVDGNPNNISPTVYIKPDLKAIELFQKALLNNVLCQISETQSVYDGIIVFGTLDKSSDIPNCRPNIFNCDGLYAITLDYKWLSYPLKNGKITLLSGVVDEINKAVQPGVKVPELGPLDTDIFSKNGKAISPLAVGESTNWSPDVAPKPISARKPVVIKENYSDLSSNSTRIFLIVGLSILILIVILCIYRSSK